jgi:hypothetical protein
MLYQGVLGMDDVGISQVRMASLEEVPPPCCLEDPIIIDETMLDSPGATQFAQIVVAQHTLYFLFGGRQSQISPLPRDYD